MSNVDRYKFSFNAADDTAEAQFFAYDDPARNIIHRNVTAVLNQLRKESGFPRFLTDVISKKYTFSIGLSDDSFGQMEDRTYVVKSVIIDHQQQAHKAKQQLLIEPSPNTSTIVPAMMDNMQTIKSSTQYEPATPIPDIISNEASLVHILHLTLHITCSFTLVFLYVPILLVLFG